MPLVSTYPDKFYLSATGTAWLPAQVGVHVYRPYRILSRFQVVEPH
jgi:hypothetical protein